MILVFLGFGLSIFLMTQIIVEFCLVRIKFLFVIHYRTEKACNPENVEKLMKATTQCDFEHST
jgi:hypothetical protein